LDQLLSKVAARGHQAVLRFYYVYIGERTTVPDYVKNSADYNEAIGRREGQIIYFPDWSSKEISLCIPHEYHVEALTLVGDTWCCLTTVPFRGAGRNPSSILSITY
jgi:hypothetical protein